jgi:hypothetical protein
MSLRKKTSLLFSGLALFMSLGFFYILVPAPALRWFKGNLHTHTIHSDGDSSPEDVLSWYKRHGYNFISLTDHNTLTDPSPYRYFVDETFILIPGNEISDQAEDKPIHVLALGLKDPTLSPAGGADIEETIQNNVSAIRRAGAVPVLAHPNFGWAFGVEEMAAIKDCRLFEVLNSHPIVNNQGGGGLPGTEEIWDILLSEGKEIYGIGTDDMHRLASYPGKSWVMVQAEELTEEAILGSLERGRFYVSTGVILDEYQVSGDKISIRIKPRGSAKFTTWFIGRGGTVLQTDDSETPEYSRTGGEQEMYIRARIMDSNGHLALTQPVFLK